MSNSNSRNKNKVNEKTQVQSGIHAKKRHTVRASEWNGETLTPKKLTHALMIIVHLILLDPHRQTDMHMQYSLCGVCVFARERAHSAFRYVFIVTLSLAPNACVCVCVWWSYYKCIAPVCSFILARLLSFSLNFFQRGRMPWLRAFLCTTAKYFIAIAAIHTTELLLHCRRNAESKCRYT